MSLFESRIRCLICKRANMFLQTRKLLSALSIPEIDFRLIQEINIFPACEDKRLVPISLMFARYNECLERRASTFIQLTTS
jgi:hypothetical protein